MDKHVYTIIFLLKQHDLTCYWNVILKVEQTEIKKY